MPSCFTVPSIYSQASDWEAHSGTCNAACRTTKLALNPITLSGLGLGVALCCMQRRVQSRTREVPRSGPRAHQVLGREGALTLFLHSRVALGETFFPSLEVEADRAMVVSPVTSCAREKLPVAGSSSTGARRG